MFAVGSNGPSLKLVEKPSSEPKLLAMDTETSSRVIDNPCAMIDTNGKNPNDPKKFLESK